MKRKLLELMGFPLTRIETEIQEAQYDITVIEVMLTEYKEKLNSIQQSLEEL